MVEGSKWDYGEWKHLKFEISILSNENLLGLEFIFHRNILNFIKLNNSYSKTWRKRHWMLLFSSLLSLIKRIFCRFPILKLCQLSITAMYIRSTLREYYNDALLEHFVVFQSPWLSLPCVMSNQFNSSRIHSRNLDYSVLCVDKFAADWRMEWEFNIWSQNDIYTVRFLRACDSSVAPVPFIFCSLFVLDHVNIFIFFIDI